MTTVRTDVFKLGDKFATLLGDEVKVGQAAPELLLSCQAGRL